MERQPFTRSGTSTATSAVAPDIHDLVAELIRQVQVRSGAAAGVGRLLCDIEVAGVRCLLIREGAEHSRTHMALTPRERTIVDLVAAGLSNRAIAGELRISSSTVSAHLRRVCAKLGVKSRAAVVARLVTEGQLGFGRDRSG